MAGSSFPGAPLCCKNDQHSWRTVLSCGLQMLLAEHNKMKEASERREKEKKEKEEKRLAELK